MERTLIILLLYYIMEFLKKSVKIELKGKK
jgi:hypothetical protein